MTETKDGEVEQLFNNIMTMNLFKNSTTMDKIVMPTLLAIGLVALYYLFLGNILNFLYIGGAVLLTSSIFGTIIYIKEHSRIKNASGFTSPFGETYKVKRPMVQNQVKTPAVAVETMVTRSASKKVTSHTPRYFENDSVSEIAGLTAKKPKKNNL